MLETKDLVKIYKPKKGVPVKALDKVTLKFPEKGMVFLLGKSGSGKSTLLNVLGGLDIYNDGEIIIKGVSSKKFKQKHFDSYRNTYVGFIFQEYNILDDFSVGANIALAIELQNRKASDDEVNRILKEVDLEGFGNRKPNELSGGQKQRVAIARALVKNPQIIMADEPSGALDSNTGKAIFDTLKKLSSEKLVIVVSHDREFAEQYADRIIELSDGKVISDVEYNPDETATEENIVYSGNTVSITAGYHITEEDRLAINRYIDSLQGKDLDINISSKKTNFKKFVNTDVSKIGSQDGSTFKLIKSKLPLKNAFKIGASSLGHKKFRLVITILLSCIAFGLFGLSDTFGAYNHIKTCTNSLVDSNVKYVPTAKSKLIGEGKNAYWRDYGYSLSDSDLADIEKNTGVKMHGVFMPLDADLNFERYINPEIKLSETEFDIYRSYFTGFADINQSVIDDMGFKILAGNLPDGTKNEIAISEYTFEIFKKAGYTNASLKQSEDKKTVYQTINGYSDIIGKTLNLANTDFVITAVIDTNFDLERYLSLIEKKDHQEEAEQLVDYVLYSEFDFASRYSYAGLIMTGDGYVDKLIANRPKVSRITEGHLNFYNDSYEIYSEYLAKLSDIPQKDIIWLNGAKTALGEKEVIVTTDIIGDYTDTMNDFANEFGFIDYAAYLKAKGTTLSGWEYLFSNSENTELEGYTIVGIVDTNAENYKSNIRSAIVVSDDKFSKFTDGSDSYYQFCVGAMPEGKENIQNLVKYCYREDSKVRYQIQTSVTYELDMVNEALNQFAVIFLYIGLGFAAFAALMLSNFIAISISYKKQEIGILRAIGSRSNDVFRIFFAESFIIAMINFVLSALGVFAVTTIINYVIRDEIGILITVLTFDLRQIVLLFAVSILVAFVASFFPVKRIASKKPIDAIRNR